MSLMRGQDGQAPTQQQIVDWMVKHIRTVLDVPQEVFPVADRFDTYGIDSVEAVIMAGLMEEEFGIPIDPIEMFNHPSVEEFSAFFAGVLAQRSPV